MNAARQLPSGFPRAPGKTGINRVVGQLKRITIKFCKSYGDSRGVRHFIEQDVVEYATKNPGVVVYLKPRRHHSPVLVSEYLNGERHYMSMSNFTRDEVWKWMNLMSTRVGIPNTRMRKNIYTTHPSVQGPWTPFTNKDPKKYTLTYPVMEYNVPEHMPETATERLRKMFKKQNLAEREDKELSDHMKIDVQH